ncbi:MAG: hypothetical protein KC478_02805 [Bacteriovoracaceae bacterium]|nr:hypothetical protein [Bacteriovoracaceae bacterium]
MRILLLSFLIVTSGAHAQSKVFLKDIGVMALASNDLISWDSESEKNTENARLDLSTIFDYDGGDRISKGGNPQNSENAAVWSITKRLINFYKERLSTLDDSTKARIETVNEFHTMVKSTFKRLTGLNFPKTAINEMVSHDEQASMRALHDILPGRVSTIRGKLFPVKSFDLTNFVFAKFYLNDEELNSQINYYNGDYDHEYTQIKTPLSRKVVNLKEVDAKFTEKYSSYTQAEMLDELRRVGNNEIQISDAFFIHHVKELFQKGMCSTDNNWIVTDISCY